MPRFLSAEWFEAVRLNSRGDHAAHGHAGSPRMAPGMESARLVLEQVVTGSPDGNVSYFVVVEKGTARLVESASAEEVPDLTITSDWDTAAAIAKGELATQAAIMQGRLRVRGNLATLARRVGDLAGLDLVPDAVREATTY